MHLYKGFNIFLNKSYIEKCFYRVSKCNKICNSLELWLLEITKYGGHLTRTACMLLYKLYGLWSRLSV